MARPIDPNKKMEILRVARGKFAEKGYSQTAMSEIAQEAGVAHGTLYLYFPSKEGIALELSEEFFNGLGAEIVPAVEQARNLEEVVAVVGMAISFIEREHDMVQMIGIYRQIAPKKQRMPYRLEFYRQLAAAFQVKMDAGIIRSYDALVAAELVVGIVEWVAESTIMLGAADLSRYSPTLLAFVSNALQPDNC